MENTVRRTKPSFMENAVDKLTFVVGGVALGLCFGGSEAGYDHAANAAMTLASSGSFFVIDSARHGAREAAFRAKYILPSVLAGTYLRQSLNQLAQVS